MRGAKRSNSPRSPRTRNGRPSQVVGHIEPDHHAITMLDIWREAFAARGHAFAEAVVLGHIGPDCGAMSTANHRASDGPAPRSTCPRCHCTEPVVPALDELAFVCPSCNYIWERIT